MSAKSLLLSMILCMAFFSAIEAQEPTQEDIQEWTKQLREGDRQGRRDAAYELMQVGPRAAPAVRELMRGVRDRDEQVWFYSIRTLANIGPAAAPAIGDLVDQLDSRSDQRRYLAAYALGKIGVKSRDALIKALSDRNHEARESAAQALAWLGKDAGPAVPALIDLFGDRESVREQAARAVAQVGSEVVGPVLEQLDSDDADVRATALLCVAQIERIQPVMAEQLKPLLKDEDPSVRAAAVRAVVACTNSVDPWIDVLATALADESSQVRQSAIDSLAANRKASKDVVTMLTSLLDHDRRETRHASIYLLGRQGSLGLPAVERLVRLGEDHPQHQEAIQQTIVRLGAAAVPDLLKALPDAQQSASMIGSALGEIGDDAREPLVAALNAKTPAVRASAIRALGNLQPDRELRSAVRKAMTDPIAAVRAAATSALLAWPDLDDQDVDAVQKALSDSDDQVRAAAIGLFTRNRLDRQQQAKLLPELLTSDSPAIQQAVLKAIAQSEAPTSALDGVIELTQSADPNVRITAYQALAAFSNKQDSESLLGTLQRGLQDRNPRVRLASAQLVKQLPKACAALVKELSGLVGDGDEAVVLAALEAIASSKTRSKEIVATLKQIDQRSEAALRIAAIRILPQVCPDDTLLRERLIERLDDRDWTVRAQACHELGSLGDKAQAAVPKLFLMLDSDDDENPARNALKKIDSAGPEAIPVLIKGLDRDDGRMRYYAVFLLGRAGTAAADALPKLRELEKELRNSEDSRDQKLHGFLQSTIAKIEGRG